MDDQPHTAPEPPWTQAEMIRLMDVQPEGAGHYLAPAHGPSMRNVVEAGQMLGDGIVAAAKEIPGQRVVSASMIFSRVAAHDAPLAVDVDVVRAGRTFSTAQVRVLQHDAPCCAGLVLLDAGAPDLIRTVAPMPLVDPPERAAALETPGSVVDGREMRVVGDAYTPDPDRIGPPELFVWTRYRDAPDSAALHAALLSQSTGHWTVAAALRPHAGFGQAMAHSAISTGITMATITFHDEPDVSQWLLYSTRVIYAGRGHAQSEGRVHAADGRLMASYSVHAMVRGFRPSDGAARAHSDTVL
ncbi:putative acyl-CoA thioesterase [Nocardia nova SH22a]|uniref:Putative acyl-CoA thioesterase n=1 Tax=Nocardia nova SH22a TaxID=1415166 RepID=W5TKR0_9NOCA|nr:acyl-CoA thioesterase domain-containing protein [Nocardia nova]AHH17821.1 putative acyl-CoA thioesterase [Nocardia nova SH22a]